MMEPIEEQQHERGDRWVVVVLILALSVGSALYRILMHEQLGHSAALFLGIPAILAILLAFAPKSKTVTGGIIKGITMALLLVAPLLGEGYLCILFASPLFYFVGILVGSVVDYMRRRRGETLTCLAVLLLPMCLEGVVPELTFYRGQSVSESRVVHATEREVAAALEQSPRIGVPLPRFLRIGFPRPLEAAGTGLEVGASRTIHFAGAEGDPPGDLVMRVAAVRTRYVLFETVSDASKLTQWIRWTSSEVNWKAVDATHTEVVWTIHFDRQLDPAWYFGLWERLAVKRAALYLIEANATPAEGVER